MHTGQFISADFESARQLLKHSIIGCIDVIRACGGTNWMGALRLLTRLPWQLHYQPQFGHPRLLTRKHMSEDLECAWSSVLTCITVISACGRNNGMRALRLLLRMSWQQHHPSQYCHQCTRSRQPTSADLEWALSELFDGPRAWRVHSRLFREHHHHSQFCHQCLHTKLRRRMDLEFAWRDLSAALTGAWAAIRYHFCFFIAAITAMA